MKKYLSAFLCVLMVMSHWGPAAAAENTVETIILTPESFDSYGVWTMESFEGSYEGIVLASSNAGAQKAGAAKVLHLAGGSYRIFVRSKDFPDHASGSTNLAGARNFQVAVNGTLIPKDQSRDNPALKDDEHQYEEIQFGTHLYDGFRWEKSKEAIPLNAGPNRIEILANKSKYARFDAVVITNDPDYEPPYSQDASGKPQTVKDFSELVAQGEIPYRYEEQLAFPDYARVPAAEQAAGQIGNGQVQIKFYQNEKDGKTYIQKQTFLNGIPVDQREDGLGYLLIYARESEGLNNDFYEPRTTQRYTEPHGEEVQTVTSDAYRMGIPMWMVPDSVEIEEGHAVLRASNEYADLEAVWSVPEGAAEPEVDLTLTAKQDGAYSLGMFNLPTQTAYDDVAYILAPFRYQELRMPVTPSLVAEAYSTTSHAQMTVKKDVRLPGKEVTYGIVAAPDYVENRWVYMRDSFSNYYGSKEGDSQFTYNRDLSENISKFGLGIRGANRRDVTPSLFAPLMGGKDCRFTEGQQFRFGYRPTITVSEPDQGWYEAYTHVVDDIWKVYDYRDNYYGSLTDTIFNMYQLLLDDYTSGWDDNGKGHYNMEGRNVVTVSDPLTYLQLYLLTEDETMLEERTVPTIEYMLSRQGQHFAYSGPMTGGGGVYYESNPDPAAELGYAPIGPRYSISGGKVTKTAYAPAGYGSTTMTGLYVMSRGTMPFFRDVSLTGRRSYMTNPEIKPGSVSIPNLSDLRWQYELSGSGALLERLKTEADNYVSYRVETPQTLPVEVEKFIYIDFFPHIQALVDSYEATQNQDYLDAAVESAKRLLPNLWAAPMPDQDKQICLSQDDIIGMASEIRGLSMFYRGDQRDRIGIDEQERVSPLYPDQPLKKFPVGVTSTAARQSSEPVPEWVASRNGLGLEQTSTFKGGNQKNIIMSTWAPELIRLAKLSGDQHLETFSRNSVIGRYANYPGYYMNQFMTMPYLENTIYTGPDITNYYFHHIPVLMAALQDFLFSQSWSWSNGEIDFPNVRNASYAWFNNRHYGFAPGKMYQETDLWPWLKAGTINVNNKQIDWIGGRKDGRAAFALMNEAANDEKALIDLNTEILGQVGTAATVYAQNGSKTTAAITNGRLELTIPAKSIVTFAVDAQVTAPAFSKLDFSGNQSAAIGATQAEAKIVDDGVQGTNDVFAYAIQMNPESYYAYVYTTHQPYVEGETAAAKGMTNNGGDVKAATLYYRLDDQSNYMAEPVDAVYPYEFTVNVPADKPFTFYLELQMEDGSVQKMEQPRTIRAVEPDEAFSETARKVCLDLTHTWGYRLGGLNGTDKKKIDEPGTYYSWVYYKNETEHTLFPTCLFVYIGPNGRLQKVLGLKDITLAPGDSAKADVAFDADSDMLGGYVKVFALDGWYKGEFRPMGEAISILK